MDILEGDPKAAVVFCIICTDRQDKTAFKIEIIEFDDVVVFAERIFKRRLSIKIICSLFSQFRTIISKQISGILVINQADMVNNIILVGIELDLIETVSVNSNIDSISIC